MTQIKSGYITGTNAQLQALRPFLVAEGFWDDKEWNDVQQEEVVGECIMVYSDKVFCVFGYSCVFEGECFKIYTLSPDEDLEKAAKLIKQKFYE